MRFELEPVVRAYFQAANSGDGQAFNTLFAADARVLDEGREHLGLTAIREWEEQTRTLYKPTVEPRRAKKAGDETVVFGLVSGDFPSSPVELRFAFRLVGGRIACLSITLPSQQDCS